MGENLEKNKNLRLLEHFIRIEEGTFWPQDIQEVMNALEKEVTFSEVNAIMEQNFINKMNDITATSKRFKRDYDACLDELHKMKNTFSYDIDFI